MNGEYQVIGRSHIRVDAREKVTGRAVYADDLTMPRMVYAGSVHTTHPHAEVTVDPSAARAVPGVVCVLTAGDFPNPQSHSDFFYCTDTPKFIGDVVAVVAAENRESLEQGIRAVNVTYRDLPGVYTIEEALKEDAPIIREKGVGLTDGLPDPSKPGNVFRESHKPLRKGDMDAGFAEADVICEQTFETPFVEHAYLEPESVLVYTEAETGTVVVRSCSQQGHAPREFVADALGLPMNRVRAVQCAVGGSFGGKFELVGILSGRAAVVSRKTGRPCKMTLSREDSILESAKRHPFRTTIRVGAKRDGTITAYQARQVENCGAYNSQAPWMNIRAMGLGYGLSEQITFDEQGIPAPLVLKKYGVLRSTQMPQKLSIGFIADKGGEPGGPYGAKALGECPVVPAAPAVVNAICNALDVEIDSIPALPERVLRALREKEMEQYG